MNTTRLCPPLFPQSVKKGTQGDMRRLAHLPYPTSTYTTTITTGAKSGQWIRGAKLPAGRKLCMTNEGGTGNARTPRRATGTIGLKADVQVAPSRPAGHRRAAPLNHRRPGQRAIPFPLPRSGRSQRAGGYTGWTKARTARSQQRPRATTDMGTSTIYSYAVAGRPAASARGEQRRNSEPRGEARRADQSPGLCQFG